DRHARAARPRARGRDPAEHGDSPRGGAQAGRLMSPLCSATPTRGPQERNEMPTNVIMPQMGESIAEGTLTKWLKKPGDAVKRDEPLFEISTDKVDAEIPSPAAGTLLEILVPEGQTVPINTVVAKLGEAGESAAAAPAASAPAA